MIWSRLKTPLWRTWSLRRWQEKKTHPPAAEKGCEDAVGLWDGGNEEKRAGEGTARCCELQTPRLGGPSAVRWVKPQLVAGCHHSSVFRALCVACLFPTLEVSY